MPTPSVQRTPRAQSFAHAELLLRSLAGCVTPVGAAALGRIARRAGVNLADRSPGTTPDPRLTLDSAMRLLRACGVDGRGRRCGADAGTRALHDADAAVVRRDLRRAAVPT